MNETEIRKEGEVKDNGGGCKGRGAGVSNGGEGSGGCLQIGRGGIHLG